MVAKQFRPRDRQPKRDQVPKDWPGSYPEYLVFWALERLGKRSEIDFVYQASVGGGIFEKGGLVTDFQFINPPDLAFNVQGIYFHYEKGRDVKGRDIIARAQLAGLGIRLIFIDEDDILEDVLYYVDQALAGRDHSRLGR